MKPSVTITLPYEIVSSLLLHGMTVEQRLTLLNDVVNYHVLPAVLAVEQPSKHEVALFVVRQTISQARRNTGIVDSSNKIAQIKAFREIVGHSLFPESTRRVLVQGAYLSHGCTQPGLAEAKRFVEDHWDMFVEQIG